MWPNVIKRHGHILYNNTILRYNLLDYNALHSNARPLAARTGHTVPLPQIYISFFL